MKILIVDNRDSFRFIRCEKILYFFLVVALKISIVADRDSILNLLDVRRFFFEVVDDRIGRGQKRKMLMVSSAEKRENVDRR